jgi:16S rRNA processing protein RimM
LNRKMDFITIGEIVKTRGLRGCMKVVSFVDTSDISSELEFVYIQDNFEQKKLYNLRKIDISGKFLFIELTTIDDVDLAKTFVGCKVVIPGNMLKELPPGEYYWRDIIGLNVYNEEGNLLGQIESVFPTGSNDVYVCKGGEREILLPAIADVIQFIDIDKKVMKVKLMEGL